MRISDWSSDVCSSDLMLVEIAGRRIAATSRSPRPRNETIDVRIVNQMLDNPVAIAAAVARRILQLRANLGARFSDTLNFQGRKLPWQSDMRWCVWDRVRRSRGHKIGKAMCRARMV